MGAVTQHYVARLEVAIQKVIAVGAQQEFRQTAEIIFQRLFVEWDTGKPEKVILEIIQVPGDGLAIEAGARVTDFVVQIAAGLDLKARQHRNDFAICFHRLGSDVLAVTMVGEKFKQSRVSQVFLEIRAAGQVFGINLGNR